MSAATATRCGPTARLASAGVDAAYGAIARYAYDVGAWDTGSWLVFHGASGHPGSPHYADQVPLWGKGALIPALYAWPRIEALSRTRQTACSINHSSPARRGEGGAKRRMGGGMVRTSSTSRN